MAISTVARSGLSTFDKFQRVSAGNPSAAGVFVMAGNNGSASNYATSSDGITWTLRSGTGMGQSQGLYKIGSAFVNVGNAIATVEDPVNGPVTRGATSIAPPTTDAGTINGVVYTNNGWAIWNVWGWHFSGFGLSTGGTSTTFSSLVYGNGRWVLVTNGNISYSIATAEKYPAGLTFTNASSAITSVHRVIFANGVFLANGSNGLATSTDAITWTQRSSAGDFRFQRMAFAGGLWFAGLNSGAFYTSPDAITWTARTSMAGSSLVGATFGNGVWCVLTQAGSLFSSPDGSTWTSRTNPVPGTNWSSDSAFQGSSVLAFG
jgi:hypothetical protein